MVWQSLNPVSEIFRFFFSTRKRFPYLLLSCTSREWRTRFTILLILKKNLTNRRHVHWRLRVGRRWRILATALTSAAAVGLRWRNVVVVRELMLLRLLVLRLHRRISWLICNQLLLLLLNRSWNLLQRRTVMVNARAWTNHWRRFDSNRLATVVTSTRPTLPVHDSPIRICRSRKSNKSSKSSDRKSVV